MARFIKIWQVLFALSILTTVVLFAQQSSRLQIDTDLADMTPASKATDETRQATALLRKNIEQRILFLITADDEGLVFDAEDQLRNELQDIANIIVFPNNDELAEHVLEGLKPHRFSLLSSPQQERLKLQSVDGIAQHAQASLYSINGQLRVFSFADDPLAWHSETLLSLLPSEKTNSDGLFTATIGARLERGALNINAQGALELALQSSVESVQRNFKVEVYKSGIFFFASDAAQKSKQDISLITAGSSIAVVLLLLFVFRNVRALLLPIASVLLGVGFAFTLTHFVFGKIHVLTIVFGASLIGIVIDYSLHYFYHGANHSHTPASAPTKEKNALFGALTLSLMTSLIGYAALSFSSLQALQKVAFFSCCGLFMAWLSVISLGDLALRKPINVDKTLLPRLVSNLQKSCLLVPTKIWLLIILSVLLGGTYTYLVSQPFNDDPRIFFKANAELLANEKRVSELASDYEPGRHFVISADSIDTLYQHYETLITLVEKDTSLSTDDLTSVLSWVPNKLEQKANYLSQAKLYQADGAASVLANSLNKASAVDAIKTEYSKASQQVLTPSKVMSLFGDSLPPIWFDQDQQLVSFVLIRKGVTAEQFASQLKSFDGIEYVNTLQRTEQALSSQRQSANTLLFLAYALVTILLLLKMRRLAAFGLVLTPLCATSMVFICATVLGFDLNLFHVMALFLVLGFGMDYSIFAYEMRAHSNVTLQAILLSAITSLISFGLLGLSSIPVVASFGITLLIGNSFNLIGVIIYTRLLNSSESL
jgi:predicted exporter